ncbi:MAG: hypothetical protein R2741_10335 [Methanolobus sp.]
MEINSTDNTTVPVAYRQLLKTTTHRLKPFAAHGETADVSPLCGNKLRS